MLRYILALAASVLLLAASDISWQGDYAAAQQTALQNHKKIFVMITTPDCTWCKKLKATTLQEPAVVARLEAAYASVQVTRNVDAYPAELKAEMVPMCYFLAADGTVIDYARGYWDTDDFNLILDDVEKRQKALKERP